MRFRSLAEMSLVALAVCALGGEARAAEQEPGTPPAADPEKAKMSHAVRLENRFKIIDADKNGTIEEKEFTAGRTKEPAMKRAKAAFQRLDADKNGTVTKEEFTARGTKGAPSAAAGAAGAKPEEKAAGATGEADSKPADAAAEKPADG